MHFGSDDILEFLRAVGGRAECPVCGKNRWSMAEPEGEGTGVLLSRVDSSLTNLKASVLYVYLICDNCGFMRHHARPPIVRWHKRKRKRNKDAGDG